MKETAMIASKISKAVAFISIPQSYGDLRKKGGPEERVNILQALISIKEARGITHLTTAVVYPNQGSQGGDGYHDNAPTSRLQGPFLTTPA